MTIFTLLLDLGVNNAFALFHKLQPSKATGTNFRDFKQVICEQLVTPCNNSKKKKESLSKEKSSLAGMSITPPSTTRIACDQEKHILVSNQRKDNGRITDLNCFFCLLSRNKRKTVYGCIACQKAFYADCFAAYHFCHEQSGNNKALVYAVTKDIGKEENARLKKRDKMIGSINNLKLH